MEMIISSSEIEYLFKLGFRQMHPNDPTWPHISFRLQLPSHSFLSNAAVEIIDNEIQLFCADCTSDMDRYEVCVMRRIYNRRTLEKLMAHFTGE